MKPGAFLRLSKWWSRGTAVRQPPQFGHTPSPERFRSAVTDDELLTDIQTLHEMVAGLERLEARAAQTEIVESSGQRGYLTPDEDDRVRQVLLAYRNYRLTLYEIILRLERYAEIRPAGLRLKAFLVAFTAALTLYGKSLRLEELASRSDLIRGKLNEPEPKFNLEEGFFDEVMAGYSSLRNYGLILRAFWFWTAQRRAIRSLARVEPEPWAWLESTVVHEHRALRSALSRVLRSRLKVGVRVLWQTAFRPVDELGYGVRSRVGGRFAGFWLQRDKHQALDETALNWLRSLLRPGDVLLMRSEGKLTAALLPGFWAHAAIYLGDYAEMVQRDLVCAKMGCDDDGLGFVIEAVSPRVRMVPLRTSLDADHLLVLRPRLDEVDLRAALAESVRHLNKAYDFEFDFNLSSRVVCTGLVYRSFHGRKGIAFNLIKRLGNFTLTGDDLVAQAIEMRDGEGSLFVPTALVLRDPNDWMLVNDAARITSLLRRIQVGWRPM